MSNVLNRCPGLQRHWDKISFTLMSHNILVRITNILIWSYNYFEKWCERSDGTKESWLFCRKHFMWHKTPHSANSASPATWENHENNDPTDKKRRKKTSLTYWSFLVSTNKPPLTNHQLTWHSLLIKAVYDCTNLNRLCYVFHCIFAILFSIFCKALC